jgi:hypothetical protein
LFFSGYGRQAAPDLWTKDEAAGWLLNLDRELLRAKSRERYLALPGAFRQTARAMPGEECRNPINAFLTLPAVISEEEPNLLGRPALPISKSLHGGAASSDRVPWQSSKFHAEMSACGEGPAGSAIARARSFSH